MCESDGEIEAMSAMRRRIALPKHFVRNPLQTLVPFRVSFRSAYASSRRFSANISSPYCLAMVLHYYLRRRFAQFDPVIHFLNFRVLLVEARLELLPLLGNGRLKLLLLLRDN